MQELLRAVVPGSFPSQLTEKPMPGAGQRRFIIVDDMVYNIHGKRIEEVSVQSVDLSCRIGPTLKSPTVCLPVGSCGEVVLHRGVNS